MRVATCGGGRAMEAILALERLGYTFALNGTRVQYVRRGKELDPEEVQPLLEEVRRHREAAVSLLQKRASLEARQVAAFEAEAAELLDQMDSMDKLEWCRQWAEVMTKLKAPYTGNGSWQDWLAEVEAGLESAE
jgi:L-rhamnose mutarotase